ncbi:MAG: ABC transporter ATP-binding protein [Simkania sp.]|nr:ABC transporter ATP-binding protein [Simkania sp.]
MKFLPSHAIREIFLGPKRKNIILFSGVLIPNFLAALLEGLSFTLILLAFTALNGGGKTDWNSYPFISVLSISRWLDLLSSQQVFTLCIILAITLQALRSGLNYIGQVISTVLSTRIQTEAQRRVYQQILQFSFPCVSHYKVGDLAEYAKTPAVLIHVVMDALNRIIVSALAILVSMIMMLAFSLPLSILAIGVFGMLAMSQKFVIHRISSVSRLLSDYMVDFSKYTIQSLHGLRAIHTFDRQVNVMQCILQTLDNIAENTKKLNLWNHAIPPINEIMGIVLVGSFLVLGQWLMQDNEKSILPVLLTFITIMYRLSNRVQTLLTGAAAIAGNWGHILRLEEILEEKGKQFTPTGGEPVNTFERGIFFENVSLSYPAAQVFAIQQLSLDIPKGSTVAFVGSSGAGKSSVMDLLLRLYDPISGHIYVDQRDLKHIEISSWRKILGVVSQDTFIFNETIEENIRFGNLQASLAEIIEAARLSGAHSFISRLPQKYQTVVGERGYRLSGGERQRIALARALVRNPEILILDEATSSLDSQSEQLIQEALNHFRGKKTVIIVAHRLSTVVDMDWIFVMDKGRILEEGTHAQLLSFKGRYAFFWQIQSHQSFHQNEALDIPLGTL